MEMEDCEFLNGTITSGKFNYDDIGEALMTSFIIATMEGFFPPLLSGMSLTEPGFAPKTNSTPEQYLFFMAGVLIFGFFFFQVHHHSH